MKGFRDVLIHRYFDIRIERVWQAVEGLANLWASVETLLAGFARRRRRGVSGATKHTRLTAELHTQFAESARLETVIGENLRRLGYDL